eukprot:TRINITY_DN6855_c0_g1_i2.p1 TRINITY_DN6855_c0_g1~~TRINITY_DN6855_c0_g1_i2.p1  ORF type:complete len:450 (+),score=152.56 TRINITY_DN6855_c0_g1_i2:274-1623(+)
MLDDYMRNGQGFICVYSVIDKESFNNVNKYWKKLMEVKDREITDTVPFVLVGNKIDMETSRQVTTSEGQEMAKRFKCPFMETSAKTGLHIVEVFQEVVREIKKDRALRGYSLKKSSGPDENMLKKIQTKFAKWSILQSAKDTFNKIFKKKDRSDKSDKDNRMSAMSPPPTPTSAQDTPKSTSTSTPPSSNTPPSSTPNLNPYTPGSYNATSVSTSMTPYPSSTSSTPQSTPTNLQKMGTPTPFANTGSTPVQLKKTNAPNGHSNGSPGTSPATRPMKAVKNASAPPKNTAPPKDYQSPPPKEYQSSSPTVPKKKTTAPNPNYAIIPQNLSFNKDSFLLLPYFYANMNGGEASAILQGKAAGTFVIRYSSQPDHLAVSYVLDDLNIQNVLIGYDGSGIWMVDAEIPRKYPSLEELVQDYNQALRNPLSKGGKGDKDHYAKIPNPGTFGRM